jgi:FtsZ-binding cell division protein ZapB
MDLSPLDNLETRVRKAVEVVRSLRRENKDLKSQLEQARSRFTKGGGRKGGGNPEEVKELRKDRSALQKQLSILEKEKSQLRTRVEGIIKELDGLDLG